MRKADRTSDPEFRTMRGRVTPVQDAAVLVALLLVVIGALGFLPGITTDYGGMEFAGSGSTAELFGIVQVSVLHNVLHLAVGVVGAFMSWFLRGALWFLFAGGTAYAVLGVYGLLVGGDHAANFLPMNTAGALVNLGLGAVMIALALVMPRRPTEHSAGGDVLGPS